MLWRLTGWIMVGYLWPFRYVMGALLWKVGINYLEYF